MLCTITSTTAFTFIIACWKIDQECQISVLVPATDPSEYGFGMDMSFEPVEDLEDRRLFLPSDCPATDEAIVLLPTIADETD